MRALILAGGKGTRLMPYTTTVPKPLLPLGDTPIIEVVISQLIENGFNHITLLLNHMSHLFEAFIGKELRVDAKIDYVIEKKPLGTAGAISLVKDLPENFIILN